MNFIIPNLFPNMFNILLQPTLSYFLPPWPLDYKTEIAIGLTIILRVVRIPICFKKVLYYSWLHKFPHCISMLVV